ncbi:hypothetical protein [Wenyingzhuangia sp. 2_MG-2023]|uniref:hypothetical protein n=1 Tax=Wenyingzhuangia sp. 2_MG-2023 TaxID=3062639 RepID=UPI0026E2E33F|nr:hypothetical protein [Wenyingzhuangia sp. 2_MG-2023]MDO6737106.1 hypothetical protein [Wenyingzhuangia sp. 2_MG-2023]
MKHKIKSIKDLSKVATEENVDRLLKDLEGVLKGFVQIKKTDPKSTLEYVEWKDDGENVIIDLNNL